MPRGASEASGDRGRNRPYPAVRPRMADAGGRGPPPSSPEQSENRWIDRDHHSATDIGELTRLSRSQLRELWTQELGEPPPATLGRDILALAIAYGRQERRQGGLSKPVARELDWLFNQALRSDQTGTPTAPTAPLPRNGTILVREWQGTTHHVTVVDEGFLWNGQTYRSLSSIARAITGTNWNGPRFFGMREMANKPPEQGNG
jgi:Protein of unknown function (DUF2924)